MQTPKSKVNFTRNLLTDRKCDHGFVRVRGELHPIHDGPDGVERVVSHLRGLHLPPLPPALRFDRVKGAFDVDMVDAIPVHPISVHSIFI